MSKGTRLFYVTLFIFLFLFPACENSHPPSSDAPSETGSIAFSVVWKDAPTIPSLNVSIQAASLDCEAAGVSTVEGKVYDENNTFLAGDAR